MFSNIIWATDGSEHADRALGYAVRLAEREGASLHAIHVTETFVGPRVSGLNAHTDEDQIVARIRRETADVAIERGIRTSIDVVAAHTGGTAERIAQIARDRGADLLVVGTRGRSALAGTLLGSVTQRLLHLAPCPVLAVPPHSETSESGDPMTVSAVAD